MTRRKQALIGNEATHPVLCYCTNNYFISLPLLDGPVAKKSMYDLPESVKRWPLSPTAFIRTNSQVKIWLLYDQLLRVKP